MYKPKLFICFLGVLLFLGSFTCVSGQNLLAKGDSLFRIQRYSEAKSYYSRAFFEQKQSTPAVLLKLAFIEESLDNFVMAIFFLQQYYLFNPDKRVKNKIEELAYQNKLMGFSIDEADYAFFLYRSYRELVQNILLGISASLFLFLCYRKYKGVSLGYSPVFTLLFVGITAFFINYSITYRRAMLAEDQVYLMSGPSAGSSVQAILSKGHRLEFISQNDVWFEVRWNDRIGWVKKSDLLFFI